MLWLKYLLHALALHFEVFGVMRGFGFLPCRFLTSHDFGKDLSQEPGVELGEGGGVELGDFEGAFCVLLGLGGVVCAAGGEDVFGGHCSCRCGWDDGGDGVGWFEEWP